jgi:hypothetical protein
VRAVRQVALRFGHHNRQRKLRDALALCASAQVRSILIVGVHASDDGVNNLIERGLAAAAPRSVGLGLGPQGPPWIEYVMGDGCNLPFDDDAFDLVFSNAVIEHVGDADRQQRFVREHARVGRSWMLTTPNRWFPVEAHDHTLFTHWAQNWRNRSGSVSRLLSPRTLHALLPPEAHITGTSLSPTLTAWAAGPVTALHDG